MEEQRVQEEARRKEAVEIVTRELTATWESRCDKVVETAREAVAKAAERESRVMEELTLLRER